MSNSLQCFAAALYIFWFQTHCLPPFSYSLLSLAKISLSLSLSLSLHSISFCNLLFCLGCLFSIAFLFQRGLRSLTRLPLPAFFLRWGRNRVCSSSVICCGRQENASPRD
ncbi:unnamed protein product, partial [Linum tenue]